MFADGEFASYGQQHNFEKVIYNHSGTIMHPPGTKNPMASQKPNGVVVSRKPET